MTPEQRKQLIADLEEQLEILSQIEWDEANKGTAGLFHLLFTQCRNIIQADGERIEDLEETAEIMLAIPGVREAIEATGNQPTAPHDEIDWSFLDKEQL